MTPIETALEGAGFGVFASVLRACKYGDVFEAGGPFTIFAPVDAAFEKLPEGALDRLMNGDAALLRAVAGHHFAAGKVVSSRFVGKRIRAVTYGGESIMIDGRGDLRVGVANVVERDVLFGACVVHGIDTVLWPNRPAVVSR